MRQKDRDIIIASRLVSSVKEIVEAVREVIMLLKRQPDRLVIDKGTKSVGAEHDHIAVYYIIYISESEKHSKEG